MSDIEQICSQQRNSDIHWLHQEGFRNLQAGLQEFLQENNETLDPDYAFLKVYGSAVIGSTDIIRITGSFYKREYFSDVAVSVEREQSWYGKVRYNEIWIFFQFNIDFYLFNYRRCYYWSYLPKREKLQ